MAEKTQLPMAVRNKARKQVIQTERLHKLKFSNPIRGCVLNVEGELMSRY
jgi:hypothetical protein